ncbi:MAG TPA: hypothetical protein VFG07_04285 [Thermoplasmata archaeon]|nr:hypothetical protein [Thermoplasmata archaeon]
MNPLNGGSAYPDQERSGTNGAVTWIAAGGLGEMGMAMVLLALLGPGSLIGLFWWMGLMNSFPPLMTDLMVGYLAALSAIPILLFFVWMQPRAIGLTPESVTFRFVGRARIVPWNLVSPDLMGSSKGSLRVRYQTRGTAGGVALVYLTPAMGRALLHSPQAPKWFGPDEVLRQWGMSIDP